MEFYETRKVFKSYNEQKKKWDKVRDAFAKTVYNELSTAWKERFPHIELDRLDLTSIKQAFTANEADGEWKPSLQFNKIKVDGNHVMWHTDRWAIMNKTVFTGTTLTFEGINLPFTRDDINNFLNDVGSQFKVKVVFF